jgi:hypothetical protein
MLGFAYSNAHFSNSLLVLTELTEART